MNSRNVALKMAIGRHIEDQ